MQIYIPQEHATNHLSPTNMCAISPDMLFDYAPSRDQSHIENIAQYICLNNPSTPVRIIPSFINLKQVDPFNFCPEFAPETVCTIYSASGLDLDGDGKWDATFDGSGNFTGVAPGKLFNYTKLARFIWEHNNRSYSTPDDIANVDYMAIQLSGAIFPQRNKLNEIVSDTGKNAKFSMPITDAQFTVDDPLQPGSTLGVNVAFTTQLLTAGIDFDGPEGQQVYNEYLQKLAKQQNGDGGVGAGIFITILVLVAVGSIAISSANRSKMENHESIWNTGFAAKTPEASLANEVKALLNSKSAEEYHDAIASAARGIKLGAPDSGMQIHIAAKKILTLPKTNPKNRR